MADNGKPNSLQASMAKAKAGRTCVDVALGCVELCGSVGYGESELLEKWARDAKILDIFEGTQQIQLLIVARQLLGKSSAELALSALRQTAAGELHRGLMERFPASRPALIEVDAEGARRLHHFGELFARSAGLSGAFAARGVGRGDVVMTLVGSRVEWVLTLLACWRMGAVALPCNPQLRRKDLRAASAGGEPEAGASARSATWPSCPTASPTWTWPSWRGSSTRTAPGDAGRDRATCSRGPGADRLHLGHHRGAARGRSTPSAT